MESSPSLTARVLNRCDFGGVHPKPLCLSLEEPGVFIRESIRMLVLHAPLNPAAE